MTGMHRGAAVKMAARLGMVSEGGDEMAENNNRAAKSKFTLAADTYARPGWWLTPEPDHAPQLAQFAPISLDQMAGVALLDRMETKFVFHERRLDSILENLFDSYRVLQVNDSRLNHYRTLYFDTPDFALFRRHQAGGRNRFKVRSRSYLDTDLAFLEIKHKVKGNRTVKNRIKTADFVDRLSPHAADFLNAYLPSSSWPLEPKLWNEYTRITLVGIHNPERVTIDLNLQFRAGDQAIILPGVVIAEVKKSGAEQDSAFISLMSAGKLRVTGFSKYCVGVSMLFPEIKHNRFKPNLKMVSKLIQEGNYYV